MTGINKPIIWVIYTCIVYKNSFVSVSAFMNPISPFLFFLCRLKCQRDCMQMLKGHLSGRNNEVKQTEPSKAISQVQVTEKNYILYVRTRNNVRTKVYQTFKCIFLKSD